MRLVNNCSRCVSSLQRRALKAPFLTDSVKAQSERSGIFDVLEDFRAPGWTVALVTLLCIVGAIHFEPPLSFGVAWNAVTCLSIVMAWGPLVKFYRWFASSGILLSQIRGLGSRGHAPFGFLPMPVLSVSAFNLLSWLLILSLLVSASCGLIASDEQLSFGVQSSFQQGALVASWAATGIAAFGSIVWLSQLFCESTVGQHSGFPIVNVLILLALAGDSEFAVFLIRVFMVSLYFGAGLAKVGGSFVGGNRWSSGKTLEASVFHAFWSRPGHRGQRSIFAKSQRFVLTTRGSEWFMMMGSVGSLFFELAAPACLFLPSLAPAVGLIAWSFHFGVFWFVGIDFCSHWTPALMAFAFSAEARLPQCAAEVLACAYVGCQLIAVLTLNEARGGTGPLPFSCSPMFAMPQDLLKDDMINWFTLVGTDLRMPGTMGTVEWSGPPFSVHYLPPEDLEKMPWPVAYAGSLNCRFERVERMVDPEMRGRVCLFYSNGKCTIDADPSWVRAADGLYSFAQTEMCGSREKHLCPVERRRIIHEAVAHRWSLLSSL
uniref:Uncharacterized protein n=1 Tax=Chromera velia CCMP2878 TaxID=1169474 RepID=A0A0G4GS75_9ALVE|eukprot:Cvel_5106.t1-p1 / transcript=Cvel_5106.t1 / gene=Cvel_5106 / organism=Chromera_velia_CCMP2878 / gene_product=hypothetical protein / transcript_product=hypothetical protein / location=Cvel_scaffold233:85898-87529(+) / protein_length=544 / sequence_SO=supercontig / SO=protein_coding / is_pseudo=false